MALPSSFNMVPPVLGVRSLVLLLVLTSFLLLVQASPMFAQRGGSPLIAAAARYAASFSPDVCFTSSSSGSLFLPPPSLLPSTDGTHQCLVFASPDPSLLPRSSPPHVSPVIEPSTPCRMQPADKPRPPSRPNGHSWLGMASLGRCSLVASTATPSPPTHVLRSAVASSSPDQLCRGHSCIAAVAAAAAANPELIELDGDVSCCFDISHNTSHNTLHLSLPSLSRCDSLQLQGHDCICVEGFCFSIPGVSSKLACARTESLACTSITGGSSDFTFLLTSPPLELPVNPTALCGLGLASRTIRSARHAEPWESSNCGKLPLVLGSEPGMVAPQARNENK